MELPENAGRSQTRTAADADRPLQARNSARRWVQVGLLKYWPFLGLAGSLSALVYLLVHKALIDDAYITLSYARNLAEHFHWGLTPYRTANTATSPLNVLLLGAVTAVVRNPILALGVAFTTLNTLQIWGLLRLSQALALPRAFSVVAFMMILLNPLMLSMVGMEMTLAVTLIVLLADASARRNVTWFGVLAALLLLTRVDLIIFPIVLLIANAPLRKRLLAITLSAVVVAAPWYAFSWLALGTLVPDTLIIKGIGRTGWGVWHFYNGPLLYLQRYPVAMLLSVIPPLLGGLTLIGYFLSRAWRWRAFGGLGPVAALGIGGVAHYAAYSLLSPPPYHWYYAPTLVSLTLVFGTAVSCLRRDCRTGIRDDDTAARNVNLRAHRVNTLVAAAVPAVILLADVTFAGLQKVPWHQSVIHTNWALPSQYAEIGKDLPGRARVIQSPGEIGTLAFFCRCDIVDIFSDRGAVVPLIAKGEARSGPVMRRLLRLNFFNLDETQRPASPDAVLVYRPEPARGAESWAVQSNWRGAGSLTLEKG